MNTNNVFNAFDFLENSNDSSFLPIKEVQKISKESFKNWQNEYISRLKRILKNNISRCANKGEFNYTFNSEFMTVKKAESLVKAAEKEIVPLLNGYSIDFAILTQTDSFNYAQIKICVSW